MTDFHLQFQQTRKTEIPIRFQWFPIWRKHIWRIIVTAFATKMPIRNCINIRGTDDVNTANIRHTHARHTRAHRTCERAAITPLFELSVNLRIVLLRLSVGVSLFSALTNYTYAKRKYNKFFFNDSKGKKRSPTLIRVLSSSYFSDAKSRSTRMSYVCVYVLRVNFQSNRYIDRNTPGIA